MPNTTLGPAEAMIYATTRIIAFHQNREVGRGTGFYYKVELPNGNAIAFIVTNKHVVRGCDGITFTLHSAKGDGEAERGEPSGKFEVCGLGLGLGDAVWNHPNPDVDLSAIPVGNLVEMAIKDGFRPFLVTLSKANLPATSDWANFSALETVKMVGCPNGLFDETHALPLTRQCITASQMNVDFNGRPQFVVDMACFPGSSGSPIFLLDDFGYRDKKTNSIMMGNNRFFLVGVLFAGPLIQNDGTVTLGQTGKISIASMMHLGYAIKSTELLAFDDRASKEYRAWLASSVGQPAGAA